MGIWKVFEKSDEKCFFFVTSCERMQMLIYDIFFGLGYIRITLKASKLGHWVFDTDRP